MIKQATADCLRCRYCYARRHPLWGTQYECMVDGYFIDPAGPFPWPATGGEPCQVLRAACAYAARPATAPALPAWPEDSPRVLPASAEVPKLRRGAQTAIRVYAALIADDARKAATESSTGD